MWPWPLPVPWPCLLAPVGHLSPAPGSIMPWPRLLTPDERGIWHLSWEQPALGIVPWPRFFAPDAPDEPKPTWVPWPRFLPPRTGRVEALPLRLRLVSEIPIMLGAHPGAWPRCGSPMLPFDAGVWHYWILEQWSGGDWIALVDMKRHIYPYIGNYVVGTILRFVYDPVTTRTLWRMEYNRPVLARP